MQFKHILFPVDFSDHSRALNSEVEMLARRFGSQVTLMHVFEIPASWCAVGDVSFINMDSFNTLLDSAKQRLNEYSLNLPESQIHRVVREGDAAWEIIDWANTHNVDLTMIGTHGHAKLPGLLLGSVTLKVLHDSSCPVWTNAGLHPRDILNQGVSSIVCAIEPGDEAIPLLRFAGQLAAEFGAKVRLVHSVPEMETRPNKYFDFDMHQCLMDSARIELSKLQRQAGTDFPVCVKETAIPAAISGAALLAKADLILMGRGKTQQSFGALRSHACEIIPSSPCPVLSYSPQTTNRVSSSCNVERLAQCEEAAPPLIGCPTL